ncbi:MAG: aminotransferase class I/II-fold pyridoxal phosphate-dependent enzyme [Bacteroidota bacterium]
MAKIRHNNILDTVDGIFSLAKERGTLHLYADDGVMDGRTLTVRGKEALHFGTCGYLGLEHHPSLKAGAINAVEKYGTQFPMSKTYVSSPLYSNLEEGISKIFKAPVVLSKNCTLAHLAVIPTLIRQSDLIILDHQVHSSVQEVTRKLLGQGVSVEMIRHNNLEMLEAVIKKNRDKHDKIWYMADGVYSMYGDFAPINDLIDLAEKYEQLHLYVDDAHGMSWAGENGSGYVMSQMKGLYRKMILTATMGKAFGACGGITVFPNEEWYRKVKVFGGPMTFSVQMEPPVLGAAIASAKIHLSEKIYDLQTDLRNKIAYCNELISRTDVPLIAKNESPIFFIGAGTMSMANQLINNLLEDGIYVNLAPFPAVPAKNVGARITISGNNSFEDIELMVDRLVYNFDKSLKEVGQTKWNITKAFKLPAPQPERDYSKNNSELSIECYDSISHLKKEFWNLYLGDKGFFDWHGLHILERSFSGNKYPSENWEFKYFVIRDHKGRIVLVTFFVIALFKEDMFARVSISREMENKRQEDPFYFTSKSLIMGSLFTEGEHMYLDKENTRWKESLLLLLEHLYRIQEDEKASNIVIRDCSVYDKDMHAFMLDQGFVKVDMPEACIVDKLDWKDETDFKQSLSKRGRRHFKDEIKRYEKYVDVIFKQELAENELDYAIQLFKNVKNKNLAINSFDFPDKIFKSINLSAQCEFVILKLKEEYAILHEEADPNITEKPVAVCFCHISEAGHYTPLLIGMDYQYVYRYGIYRQMLYQLVKRARYLQLKQLNLGISASTEKKKVGATLYPKVAYFQAKDNYAAEMMAATIALEKD